MEQKRMLNILKEARRDLCKYSNTGKAGGSLNCDGYLKSLAKVDDLIKALKTPKAFKIKRHVVTGELSGKGEDSNDVLDETGRLMDKSYTNDIVGPALIESEDGKFYKIEIEAKLVEISKKDAEEIAEENEVKL